VATPIGNLGDMTARAVEVLRSVTVIAAEDTRHSAPLLRHFGIATPCITFHDHNEREQTAKLILRLRHGDSVALISDAGTPLLSDPGYHLVHAAHDARIKVISIPGASALLSALAASGMPTDRFAFEGFLPAKAAARRQRLAALRDEPRTLIFYEAPHRLLDSLIEMTAVFGNEREAALARELTKLHETVRKDRLENLLQWVRSDPQQQKGECVIVLHGAPPAAEDDVGEREARRVLDILLKELPVKQATALAAKITGERKNRLYRKVVARDK
jgi:16S rRNA (cytidine1402-2'-O)-methyltransferase